MLNHLSQEKSRSLRRRSGCRATCRALQLRNHQNYLPPDASPPLPLLQQSSPPSRRACLQKQSSWPGSCVGKASQLALASPRSTHYCHALPGPRCSRERSSLAQSHPRGARWTPSPKGWAPAAALSTQPSASTLTYAAVAAAIARTLSHAGPTPRGAATELKVGVAAGGSVSRNAAESAAEVSFDSRYQRAVAADADLHAALLDAAATSTDPALADTYIAWSERIAPPPLDGIPPVS